MWFMKYIANPLVRLVLKSRLHGILSASVLLLSYRGRKSGREYSLPVEYAQDGDVITILPGMPENKTWWRNLRGGARVRLVLRGERVSGNAQVLQGEGDRTALMAGLGSYFQHFPMSAQRRQIRSQPDGSYSAEDLRRIAGNTILVQVKLDPGQAEIDR